MGKVWIELPPEAHKVLKIEAASRGITLKRLTLEIVLTHLRSTAPTDEKSPAS